jgi:hypothetical protein
MDFSRFLRIHRLDSLMSAPELKTNRYKSSNPITVIINEKQEVFKIVFLYFKSKISLKVHSFHQFSLHCLK